MTLSERLREELDQTFGDEPADRPVDQWLADGHRALRRRRAVGALAVCGVVATLGTAYAVGGPGGELDGSGVIATDPSDTASEQPETPTSDPSESSKPPPTWRGGTVRYVHGELQVRDGAVVHEHLRNPCGYAPPRACDAFDLTFHGQRRWVIAELDADGWSSVGSSEPSSGWAGFRDWVEDQVGLSSDPNHGWPRTMRLTPDDRVVPTAGTTVLQRTDDPGLGDDFAPPGATTGAAVVTPRGDDQSYFIVWRVVDGTLDVITTPPSDTVGATFSELLTHARSQYAGGEGLR